MAFVRIVVFFSLSLLMCVAVQAQINRYMVFFKDKSGSPFTVSNPSAYLSEKAIVRRIKQGVEINSQDIPVNANYIQGVKSAGAEIYFRSRWMNGLLVQCNPALVPSLQALPYVDRVEFVAPNQKLVNGGRKKTNMRKKNGSIGFETQNQLGMIGIDHMHQADVKGKGITIAIFDSGFEGVNVIAPFQHVFSEGRINTTVSHDFVFNTSNVFQYDEHGTEVFSIIAGNIPDAYTGGAYEANYQLYVTEDVASEYRVEEYNWLFAAERADSAGVDIIQSSLGYYDFDDASMNYTTAQMDGKTAVVTKAAQWAADRGILVICSAGNEGNIPSWRIITAPADGVDVIAVAGVDSQGKRSSSSSIGPSSDGRIKPDLAAMGVSVKVVKPNGVISTATGTSLSAPLITSLAAGVWERYPELTNKEVIALLKQTASKSNNPDNALGYGIPNFKAVVNYQEKTEQTNLFEVFPNPIVDTVTIRPIDPDSVQSCSVELISSQGQILAHHTIAFNWLNRTFQANVTQLAAGLYFIRIRFDNKRYVFKLSKI